MADLKAAADVASTKEALAAKGITVTSESDGTNDFLVFTNASGENIDVNIKALSGTDAAGGEITAWNSDLTTTAKLVGTAVTYTGVVSGTNAKSADVTGRLDWSNAKADSAAGTANLTAAGALGGGGVGTLGTTTSLSSVADIDVSTAGGSQNAIDIIDAALASIDSQRADLGATQNRMDFTINNLSNIQNNVSDARSRIQDVDFASESAALSKQQILSQASSAMLAQANQLPQVALSLL